MPKVSILISVRDQLALTQKCLSKLEATLDESISFEVLIANDGSVDGTQEFLDKLGEPYRIFHRSHSVGFGKNHNWLAENAKGEYLLFLNNDAFVSGNWLHPMLSVFKNQTNVGFVGNVQRLAGTRRYDHMGVVFSPLGNPRHYGQGFFPSSFQR